MRHIYIYVAFCCAASFALSLMNVEPKEKSNAGQLRRWKSMRDTTGECVFSCIFVCVCVWSIGALGIILLLLLCFKASGSDFIKLLQPESDRTEEKAEWVCDLPRCSLHDSGNLTY